MPATSASPLSRACQAGFWVGTLGSAFGARTRLGAGIGIGIGPGQGSRLASACSRPDLRTRGTNMSQDIGAAGFPADQGVDSSRIRPRAYASERSRMAARIGVAARSRSIRKSTNALTFTGTKRALG